MFVCGGCEQTFPDSTLRYKAIHHTRVGHPNAQIFYRRFHSRECLDAFLKRVSAQHAPYVVTDLTGAEAREYGPAMPEQLRQMLGLIPATR